MLYRDRETGAYPVSRAEAAAKQPHTSLPAIWNQELLDFLELDEVEAVSPPEAPPGFEVLEVEPEQTEAGTWRQRYELAPVPPAPPSEADLSETDDTWS